MNLCKRKVWRGTQTFHKLVRASGLKIRRKEQFWGDIIIISATFH